MLNLFFNFKQLVFKCNLMVLENRNHHATNLYGDLPEKLHSLHSPALPDAIGQGRGVISRV